MACLAALSYVLLAAIAFASCHGCYIESVSGTEAGSPVNPQLNNSFTLQQTLQALQGYGSWSGQWVDSTHVTYACVDSRGTLEQLTHDNLETPGGDFGELVAAIAAYHNVKGSPATEASVDAIFKLFMATQAKITRPFYFHTSRTNLENAFAKFAQLTGQPVPVVLPAVAPSNKTLQDKWLEALTDPFSQGCGHVRYMMLKPDEYGLYGASANIPRWLTQSFFRYWWPTPEGSYQRSLISFPILLGPLDGRSVAIISTSPSALFLYNAPAVKSFRSLVLGPLIKIYDASVDEAAVVAAIEELQGKQLAATLKLLPPVNALPLYAVNITVKD